MKIQRRALFALSIGTILEWAEFVYYAYMAILFTHLFFPTLGKHALLAVFAVFGVSFIARPIGALFFGHIGDRYGRRRALMGAMLLMGLSALCMGLLPTYQAIGVWSPILLVLFRILQGASISSEFMGAAVYAVENRFSCWRFLPSSIISAVSALGMLLGASFAYLVSLPQMPVWSWRLPYFVGALLCFLAMYMRRAFPESVEYQAIAQQGKVARWPIKLLWRQQKLALLKIIAIAGFVCFYVYTCNVWWVSFVITKHYFSMLLARKLNVYAQIFVVVLTPLVAIVANRFNEKKGIVIGLLGAAVTAVLIFYAASFASIPIMLMLFFAYALFDAMVTALMFVYFARILPTPLRFSGQAIAWNLAVAVFGSIATPIAMYLSGWGNVYIALPIVLSALVAVVTI